MSEGSRHERGLAARIVMAIAPDGIPFSDDHIDTVRKILDAQDGGGVGEEPVTQEVAKHLAPPIPCGVLGCHGATGVGAILLNDRDCIPLCANHDRAFTKWLKRRDQ